MARFEANEPTGVAVQELEILVRTAIFRSANDLFAHLLQKAADRIDASYRPKPGEQYKQRVQQSVHCILGSFELTRAYYYRQTARLQEEAQPLGQAPAQRRS